MNRPDGDPRRARYVHIVAAAYSNPDPASPRGALKRYDPAAPAGPTLLRDMERACRNALGALTELPAGDASPVTHLFGITLPDRDFSVNALHAFYDFKSRLALGQRCQVRFEVGSSDAGAVLLASALRLLEGTAEPSTALVVAGQEIAPDARRNVRDFVGQVIDARERAAGLNMIPLGDMVMDAIAHRAATTPGALAELLREDSVRDLLALWTRRKLRHGATYAPAQRGPSRPGTWSRAQGRWLGSQDMAAASVGACAVLLTTDPAVIARAARDGVNGPRRVRVLGVGEGDARPAVTDRGEPLVFFKAMRQALSGLRRATGTNLDFLRAAGFAVLHDAFPSIELALLSSLGFSPTDAAQRAAGWWPNARGGLMASGHAFAASGLVQVAQAFHTLTRPASVERAPLPADLARVVAAPRPVHCVTASVGGPLSHVVATLLQSVPATDDDLDAPFDPPPRHRRDPREGHHFEEKSAWVVAVSTSYREALARSRAGSLRRGVLEARTVLRLDALMAAMLPLPLPPRDRWDPPRAVRYRGVSWELPGALLDALHARLTRAPRESLPPPIDGASDAPRRVFVSDDDVALRDELEAMVSEVAAAAVRAASSRPGADPAWSASELRDEMLCALGVPVGLLATDADAPHPHELAVIAVPGRSLDALPVGTVLALEDGAFALPVATAVVDDAAGLVPPWYAAPTGDGDAAGDYEAMLPRVDGMLRALREAASAQAHLGALRALAEEGAEIARSRPAARPPGGLVALFHALVLDPDEDRGAMALALARWRDAIGSVRATVAPDPPLDLAATVLVDIVGAGARSLSASVGQLDVVARAMRRPEAWLAGARVEHARIADTFCLTAWLPAGAELDDATSWTPLLTYARDVYQHCLDHDVAARVLVTAGRALPFHELDATGLGAVSAAGFALEAVLHRCLGARFAEHFDAARRDGVVAVLREADARRIGGSWEGDGALAAAFEAVWRVEGERPRTATHRGPDARAEGRCGVLSGAGGVYVYQLRQRARG